MTWVALPDTSGPHRTAAIFFRAQSSVLRKLPRENIVLTTERERENSFSVLLMLFDIEVQCLF